MNTFELFSFIFFMLDSCWDDCKNDSLGQFLSGMNPYAWSDESSADPAWYEEFKTFMKDKTIGSDNGFEPAKTYLKTITIYPGLGK